MIYRAWNYLTIGYGGTVGAMGRYRGWRVQLSRNKRKSIDNGNLSITIRDFTFSDCPCSIGEWKLIDLILDDVLTMLAYFSNYSSWNFRKSTFCLTWVGKRWKAIVYEFPVLVKQGQFFWKFPEAAVIKKKGTRS